jgi:hypothetical protein
MDREGMRRVEQAVTPDLMALDVTPPDGRRFWLSDSMLPEGRRGQIKPTFTITQVAKVFFARSADWLRWLGTKQNAEGGVFELDGQALEIKRTESGNRVYTLVDVERLAHALLEHGKIDGVQFTTAINILRLMAYQYKILTDQDMTPRPAAGQLPIEGIDRQINEIGKKAAAQAADDELRQRDESCESCQRDEHEVCDVAYEIAVKRNRGLANFTVEDHCGCYFAAPDKHTGG